MVQSANGILEYLREGEKAGVVVLLGGGGVYFAFSRHESHQPIIFQSAHETSLFYFQLPFFLFVEITTQKKLGLKLFCFPDFWQSRTI